MSGNNDSWFYFNCTRKAFTFGILPVTILIYSCMKILFLELFFFIYRNSCFLNKKFKDLGYLPKTTKKTFDVIAINGSRIMKDSKNCFDKMFLKNANINDYSLYQLNFLLVELYNNNKLLLMI